MSAPDRAQAGNVVAAAHAKYSRSVSPAEPTPAEPTSAERAAAAAAESAAAYAKYNRPPKPTSAERAAAAAAESAAAYAKYNRPAEQAKPASTNGATSTSGGRHRIPEAAGSADRDGRRLRGFVRRMFSRR